MTAQQIVSRLLQAANQNQSLVLTRTSVRELALVFVGMDNMLAAYINEYGNDLAEALVEGNVVDAEVVEENDETETEIGFDSEDAGLDASEEE